MEGLPKGWIVSTLDQFTQARGSSINPAKFPMEEFELYSVPSYDTGAPERVSGSEIGSSKQAIVSSSVLLCKINPRINRAWVVGSRDELQQIASTEWIVFPPRNGIDPKFLCFFLRQNAVRDFLAHNVSGVGGSLMRVKPSTLKGYPFPIAPLNEQRRIVEKIETLFARLDKGEEALRAVRTLLARYRQSVLKAAVTGQLTADWRAENAHRLEHGRDLLARILQTRRDTWQGRGKYKEPTAPDTSDLPELPEGWVWATLEHLGFVKSGQTPKSVDALVDPAGTIPWFKVSSMNEPGNEVELRTSQWIFTEDGAKAVGLNLLPTGTIAFPKRGGAILTNKKRRLGCRAALDLNTMGFVPVALEDYVWAFFQGLDLRTIYDGSNVPQINYHDIADVPIALPSSIEEAGVIADLVGESIEQTARLEVWCETELARSAALRQSILKDAFAGRLVPQDPADEPAADLLARITETRAAAPRKTRRKATETLKSHDGLERAKPPVVRSHESSR